MFCYYFFYWIKTLVLKSYLDSFFYSSKKNVLVKTKLSLLFKKMLLKSYFAFVIIIYIAKQIIE